MPPPGSAAAQVVKQLLQSKNPVLRVPGQPVIQEIHDLAVRLCDLDAPGRQLHLSVKPDDVVDHRKSLARAAQLLDRSAHRLELQLEVEDDRSGQVLWAIRSLQKIHKEHPQALGFSLEGTVHPAILRHFGLADPAPADPSEAQHSLWLVVLRRCQGQDSQELAKTISGELGTTGTLERPVLFLLDRPGQWLELVPKGPVGRRCEFEVGRRGGDDPRLQNITDGGTIEIKPGEISIQKDGQQLASFFLTAFVFSHQAGWDPEFWIPCALQALAPEQDAAREEPADAPVSTAVRPEPARETVALAEKLRALLLPPPARAQFEVVSLEPSLGRHVVITLRSTSRSDQELIVLVEPREGADKFFCEAGRLVLSYSDQTPLDTPFRNLALEELAARLAGE